MTKHLAIHVEQCSEPKIAGAVPHHVGKARISHRVDDLAAVDVGPDNGERRYHDKIVAAGTDHELRRARAAEIYRLEEMDMTRDGHAHARRHDGSERQLLHPIVNF